MSDNWLKDFLDSSVARSIGRKVEANYLDRVRRIHEDMKITNRFATVDDALEDFASRMELSKLEIRALKREYLAREAMLKEGSDYCKETDPVKKKMILQKKLKEHNLLGPTPILPSTGGDIGSTLPQNSLPSVPTANLKGIMVFAVEDEEFSLEGLTPGPGEETPVFELSPTTTKEEKKERATGLKGTKKFKHDLEVLEKDIAKYLDANGKMRADLSEREESDYDHLKIKIDELKEKISQVEDRTQNKIGIEQIKQKKTEATANFLKAFTQTLIDKPQLSFQEAFDEVLASMQKDPNALGRDPSQGFNPSIGEYVKNMFTGLHNEDRADVLTISDLEDHADDILAKADALFGGKDFTERYESSYNSAEVLKEAYQALVPYTSFKSREKELADLIDLVSADTLKNTSKYPELKAFEETLLSEPATDYTDDLGSLFSLNKPKKPKQEDLSTHGVLNVLSDIKEERKIGASEAEQAGIDIGKTQLEGTNVRTKGEREHKYTDQSVKDLLLNALSDFGDLILPVDSMTIEKDIERGLALKFREDLETRYPNAPEHEIVRQISQYISSLRNKEKVLTGPSGQRRTFKEDDIKKKARERKGKLRSEEINKLLQQVKDQLGIEEKTHVDNKGVEHTSIPDIGEIPGITADDIQSALDDILTPLIEVYEKEATDLPVTLRRRDKRKLRNIGIEGANPYYTSEDLDTARENLKEKLKSETEDASALIQDYANSFAQRYRKDYRAQFLTENPNATPEEIKEAVETATRLATTDAVEKFKKELGLTYRSLEQTLTEVEDEYKAKFIQEYKLSHPEASDEEVETETKKYLELSKDEIQDEADKRFDPTQKLLRKEDRAIQRSKAYTSRTITCWNCQAVSHFKLKKYDAAIENSLRCVECGKLKGIAVHVDGITGIKWVSKGSALPVSYYEVRDPSTENKSGVYKIFFDDESANNDNHVYTVQKTVVEQPDVESLGGKPEMSYVKPGQTIKVPGEEEPKTILATRGLTTALGPTRKTKLKDLAIGQFIELSARNYYQVVSGFVQEAILTKVDPKTGKESRYRAQLYTDFNLKHMGIAATIVLRVCHGEKTYQEQSRSHGSTSRTTGSELRVHRNSELFDAGSLARIVKGKEGKLEVSLMRTDRPLPFSELMDKMEGIRPEALYKHLYGDKAYQELKEKPKAITSDMLVEFVERHYGHDVRKKFEKYLEAMEKAEGKKEKEVIPAKAPSTSAPSEFPWEIIRYVVTLWEREPEGNITTKPAGEEFIKYVLKTISRPEFTQWLAKVKDEGKLDKFVEAVASSIPKIIDGMPNPLTESEKFRKGLEPSFYPKDVPIKKDIIKEEETPAEGYEHQELLQDVIKKLYSFKLSRNIFAVTDEEKIKNIISEEDSPYNFVVERISAEAMEDSVIAEATSDKAGSEIDREEAFRKEREEKPKPSDRYKAESITGLRQLAESARQSRKIAIRRLLAEDSNG